MSSVIGRRKGKEHGMGGLDDNMKTMILQEFIAFVEKDHTANDNYFFVAQHQTCREKIAHDLYTYFTFCCFRRFKERCFSIFIFLSICCFRDNM
mmetsp:Transcript_33971/g.51252  ORF Transcript_33971/g.51252 Transcript_33971/m.51252 type:complete len:94 (+) Transcript_33971:596-877(+)